MALTVEELQIVLSCDATTAQAVLEKMDATVKAYTQKFQKYFNTMGGKGGGSRQKRYRHQQQKQHRRQEITFLFHSVSFLIHHLITFRHKYKINFATKRNIYCTLLQNYFQFCAVWQQRS